VLWTVVIVRFGRTTVATVDGTHGELAVRTRILGINVPAARAVPGGISIGLGSGLPLPALLEARIELTDAGAPPVTAAVRYANGDGTVPAEVLALARDIADAAGLPTPRVE